MEQRLPSVFYPSSRRHPKKHIRKPERPLLSTHVNGMRLALAEEVLSSGSPKIDVVDAWINGLLPLTFTRKTGRKTMNSEAEYSVTLTPELFERLRAESKSL